MPPQALLGLFPKPVRMLLLAMPPQALLGLFPKPVRMLLLAMPPQAQLGLFPKHAHMQLLAMPPQAQLGLFPKHAHMQLQGTRLQVLLVRWGSPSPAVWRLLAMPLRVTWAHWASTVQPKKTAISLRVT
jgi:hypothetical protein